MIYKTGNVYANETTIRRFTKNIFERLKRTHPKQYEYCLGGGEYNEEGLWQPNEKGLGMKHVFDVFNELYPNTPIRY